MDVFTTTADGSSEVPNVPRGQQRYRSYQFEEDEWVLIDRIHTILTEATALQKQFSSETQPTVWKLIVGFEEFIGKWKDFTNNDDFRALRPALEAGLEKIEKYYEKAVRSPASIVSIYLNPCLKGEYFKRFWMEEGQEHARETMETVFDRYYDEHRSTTTANVSSSRPAPAVNGGVTRKSSYGSGRMMAAVEQRFESEQRSSEDLRDEFKRYLKDRLAALPDSGELDVISWWKDHALMYPVLAKIACDFLSVQGSSVPCERMFSSAGLTDTNRRNRLDPQTFAAIETVKSSNRVSKRQKLLS